MVLVSLDLSHTSSLLRKEAITELYPDSRQSRNQNTRHLLFILLSLKTLTHSLSSRPPREVAFGAHGLVENGTKFAISKICGRTRSFPEKKNTYVLEQGSANFLY